MQIFFKIEGYKNKGTTLQYKVFTIKKLRLEHVSAVPYGSSSGRVH